MLPAGVSVYGGFPAGGSASAYRNPKAYLTVLTGYANAQTSNQTVVTMGNETLLDGFVVEGASGKADSPGQGILCQDVSAIISNCVVRNNLRYCYGIYADNSDVEITWCRVENNRYDGIRHEGNSKSVVVENCQINGNQQHGIYIKDSAASVKNNALCNNGIDGTGYFGIRCIDPKDTPLVYNNTIVYNKNEAFSYADSDPNHVNIPDIQNCILWYNNVDGNKEQFAGWKIRPKFSCVYDPNHPEGLNYSIDPNNNFSGKPGFAYPYSDDPNVTINVHLAYNSYCKDRGNPVHVNDDVGLNDMDTEDRIIDSRVDVGADEISCTDVYNVRDWNGDGLVNLIEFNFISRAWLSHAPNDPALTDPNYAMYSYYNDPNSVYYVSLMDKERWEPICNFVANGNSQYVIDATDLLMFIDADPNSSTNTDRWLWQACWLSEEWQAQQQSMIAMQPGSQQQEMTAAMPMETDVAEIPIPEKSIAQQLAETKEAAQWLEELWLTEPELQNEIDAASWKEFMDAVNESIKELEQLNTQTLSESEELL